MDQDYGELSARPPRRYFCSRARLAADISGGLEGGFVIGISRMRYDYSVDDKLEERLIKARGAGASIKPWVERKPG
jgi:hypothetical protein